MFQRHIFLLIISTSSHSKVAAVAHPAGQCLGAEGNMVKSLILGDVSLSLISSTKET